MLSTIWNPQAVKFNYSNSEKTALIELLAMIKDVSRLLWQMRIPLGDEVRRDMYHETQTFVQLTLREVIHHAGKKKSRVMQRKFLDAIRSTAADWLDKQAPTDDPLITGKKNPGCVPEALYRRLCGGSP